MAGPSVRPEPNSHGRSVVAVTGAASPIGRLLLERLADNEDVASVVGIDADSADVGDVDWRAVDVRDPAVRDALAGADVVVHLAGDRDADASTIERRAINVRGTDTLLAAAVAAGVQRVVLLTSAMVYGASADNAVPLPEDAAVLADPDVGLVGDWVEMERLATRMQRAHPSLQVTRVRPASLVAPCADHGLPRMFDAPRLLVIKGSEPRWQFCHVDDLISALELAAAGQLDGPVTVACDGWLSQEEVEQISGMRSIVVPSSVAFATAERLHRVGVLPTPAAELRYLAHPWVVDSTALRKAGWAPKWTNEAALRQHLDSLGERRPARLQRKDATRAAAGAAVAVVGTVAIARARAARRRRLG